MRKQVAAVAGVMVAVSVTWYAVSNLWDYYDRSRGVSGTGTVEAFEYALGSPLGGIIDEIKVDEGDEVKAGDVMGVIRHRDLAAEEDGLVAALAAADANLREAGAKLRNAERTVERLRSLTRAGSVTQQTYDDANTSLEAARAANEAANHNRARLTKQIESLREKVAYATVTTPVNGTVVTRHFEAGEMAPPGSPLVTVARLDEVWVRVYVSEATLARIKTGQEASVTVDGVEKPLAGKVAWISPRAEFTPKNVQTREERVKQVFAVKVTVPNPERLLKVGAPADAVIRF